VCFEIACSFDKTSHYSASDLSQSQASVHPAPPTPEQAPQNPSTLSSSCMEVVQIERKLVQVDSRTYQRDARKQVKQLQALANDVCQMFKYLEDLVQACVIVAIFVVVLVKHWFYVKLFYLYCELFELK